MTSPSGTAPPGLALPVEGAEAERLALDVEQEVQLPIHVTGADALEAVLCVLSRHLSGGEAADLLEALPAPARPRRCYRHRVERRERFGREVFIERVATHLLVSNDEAEAIARAVWVVLPRWLPPREVADRLAERILREVQDSGVLPAKVNAADAVTASLCVLSRRLTRGQVRDLLLALPPGLRPRLEHCAFHRPEPADPFDRAELVSRIGRQLGVSSSQAVSIARTVFLAVQRALPPKEIHDITS